MLNSNRNYKFFILFIFTLVFGNKIQQFLIKKNQIFSLNSVSGCCTFDDKGWIFCMAITCIPSSGVTIIISFDRVRRRKVIKSSVGSKSRTVSRALLAQKSNFELMRNVTLLSSDVY
jgi:hypothetical protein